MIERIDVDYMWVIDEKVFFYRDREERDISGINQKSQFKIG